VWDVSGNGNELCGEGRMGKETGNGGGNQGMRMAEHGMAAYPLLS
jgi:hypothetical protein